MSSSDARQVVERLDATCIAGKNEVEPELSVGIVLCPHFPLLSLAGLTDALRHAADIGDQSRPLRCRWAVVGRIGQRVRASSGVEVNIQQGWTDPRKFDYVVVIGGLLTHLDEIESDSISYLHQAAEAGVCLIGLCTGSFVLARCGLMQGHLACVHAFHEDDWKRLFPSLPFVTHADYLVDGNRITCAGGVSIIELATELIGKHCGQDRAAKVVHQMTVSKRGTHSFVDRRKALGYLTVTNATVRRAVMLMEQHLGDPLDMSTIARLSGTGVRQLERSFRAETDLSPAEFYRVTRLRYARWLLTSSSLALSEIAYECGFADVAHFTRQFQRQFGITPGKLKKALHQLDGRGTVLPGDEVG
jgi:transcriptional regulator GlxA family with amidase domain